MSKINEYLEKLTSQILLDNDMYKVPVNIIAIAKAYGINVYEGDLDKKISGAIRYDRDNDKFEILVNKNDAIVRQRFTIAHELGHYFLHQDMLINSDIHVDTLYRTETEIDTRIEEQEKEVDYFAGALLMNKILLEKLYDEYYINGLAKIFKVSASAMTVRLDILGML